MFLIGLLMCLAPTRPAATAACCGDTWRRLKAYFLLLLYVVVVVTASANNVKQLMIGSPNRFTTFLSGAD